MSSRRGRPATRGAWLVALLALGCGRCAPNRPHVAAPAELLPSDVDTVAVVPRALRLSESAQRLTQLKAFGLVASLTGLGDDGPALLRGLDPASLRAATAQGFDPEGEVLAANAPRDGTIFVFPLSDASKASATVERLVRERLRATVRVEHDGVTSFSPAQGAPVAAWLTRDRWGVLATGPGCVEVASAALHQDAAHSLQAQPSFAAFDAAHRDADALFWSSGAGLTRELGLENGARVALTLAPHQLRALAEVPLSTAQAAGLASLHGDAGRALVGRLDPDAFFVARTALDTAALWPIARQLLPASMVRQLEASGVQPAQVLTQLAPGAALSLSLPPTLDLARMPSFDPRETNPFRYVGLAALGQLKDPRAARATLEGLQKAGPTLGAQLARHEVGPVPVYTFSYALGEGASIAIDGDRVALSGGAGRMAPLLARAAGQGPTLPPAVAARFDSAGLAAWLDVPRVVKDLRAQPESAFGLGGFAIRAALLRWLDALDELRGVLLLADARADAAGTTLQVELQADLP